MKLPKQTPSVIRNIETSECKVDKGIFPNQYQYRRGEEVDQYPNYVGLCNYHSSWKILPEDYEPRLLPEKSCTTDTRCLRGNGTCQQQYISYPVYKIINRGTPQEKRVVKTTQVKTGCECQVGTRNPFIPIVIGR